MPTKAEPTAKPTAPITGHRRAGAAAAAPTSSVTPGIIFERIHIGPEDTDTKADLTDAVDTSEQLRHGRAAIPGDTGLFTDGLAQVLGAADLRPDYYLWSLPTRTLDPRLHQLTREVRQPRGPDWIVEWMPFDTWGLDAKGTLQAAVGHHCRAVGTVCGVPTYLRSDLHRKLPPRPSC